jgi:hypothetical protein
MHKLVAGLAVLAVAVPLSAISQSAWAQSVFDGTWKTDPHTMTWAGKPTQYDLSKGVYTCATCVPPIKVKADGAPHPVAGNPYIDMLSVKVVDAHTVSAVGAKGAQTRGVQTFKVSDDGKTLTMDFKGRPLNPGAAPATYMRTYTRVAAAPAGAHAISGSWRRSATTAMSGAAGVNTFKMDGTMLHWSSPGGQSYTAALDGKPYPVKGDPGADSVMLQKVSDSKIVETDWLKGKKVDVTTWSVSPSGKTLTMVDNDPESGLVTTAKAMKP